MLGKDPVRTLERVRTRLKDAADVRSGKELVAKGAMIAVIGLLIGVDPVAAQAGSVDQIVRMMERLSDLLFRLGMATAVVGLSVAAIAYMVHKPRLAKEIAKNVIIGTLILLFSSAAIDWLAGGV